MTPNQAIKMVLNHKLQIGKDVQMKCGDLSQDKKVYIELIRFLLGQKITDQVLPQQMHGDHICLLSDLQMYIQVANYDAAIPILKQLIKHYGHLHALYHPLREAYIATNKYAELDELNAKASHNRDLRPIPHEGTILSLKQQISQVRELESKLVLIEKVYKLQPSNSENLSQYLSSLQKLGHFKAGIEVIKSSAESSNEFVRIAVELFATEDPKSALHIASNMRDSFLKYVLVFSSALRARDYQTADRVLSKIHKVDSGLARILELKLYQHQADTAKVCWLLDSFTYARSNTLDGGK